MVAPADRAVVTMAPGGAEWMTVGEIAARLGVGPRAVRAWIRRGYLPAERRPRRGVRGAPLLWVRRADVRAFAESHYRGKPRPAWLDEPEPPSPS